MQDLPSPADILDLAIAQMGAGAAVGDARAKFEARVARAALELVRREIELAPLSDAAERARLSALLGEEGDLATLNQRFCARIRDGALTLQSPGVAEHVRATTMEKLAVDQPTYAAYRRAPEASEG